jgi:uncharacterized protein (TIGR04255 family)
MTESKDDAILTFSRPPVAEVVCGVQFHPLPIQTAHFGTLWEKFRSSYGTTLDQPPLPQVIETNAGMPSSTFTWSALPELRRVFFVDGTRGRLVQVQPNRFHHNWQRRADDDTYPRFPELRAEFLDRWNDFRGFLDENQLPAPHVVQSELTYINHIPAGPLWDGSGLQSLFPWFAPRNAECVGAPEVELALHYDLPECRGRLHVTIRTAVRARDSVRVVAMDLTARGAPEVLGESSDLSAWFGSARKAIVCSFAELTGPEAHKHWGRSK